MNTVIILKVIVKILITLSLLSVLLPFAASATTVKSVYAGYECSFALDAGGDVWVWGEFHGKNYVDPVKVPFIDHVAMVTPGAIGDAVVLKDDGTVWAWGSLQANEIGSFPGDNSTSPVRINISNVKYIAKGLNTIYMVKTDGTLWMCGRVLCLGLDDLLSGEHFIEPVRLPVDNVSRVVATMSSVYAQREDGSWWGWGENRDYQLDDGTSLSRELPVKMLLDNVTSISAESSCFGVNDEYVSNSVVLALDGAGQLYGWGDNTYWVSGDSKLSKLDVITSPHPVPGMSDVKEIGCGIDYYAVLKKDGTVWAWGSNPNCCEGRVTLDSNTPVRLAGFTDIVSIIVGKQHLLAVKKDGTVWAWGMNMKGELGNGEVATVGGKPYAVQVTGLYVDLPDEPRTAVASATAAPSPGFTFDIIAVLGCLFVSAGLVSGAIKRKK
ncbi:MAG: chromosome condensation regulator RCC1 [Methanocella sp.]